MNEMNKLNNFIYFQRNGIDKIASDSILHHYTSPSGLIGIIKEKKIRHTNINCLNDKSEYRYTYDLIKKEILADTEISAKLIANNLYDFIKARCENSIDDNLYKIENEIYNKRTYYISCFSLNEDSLPMWNYYTSNGTSLGYCIDIYLEDFKINKDSILAPVCYDKQTQIAILKEIFNTYIYPYDENKDMKEDYNNLFENIRICSLFFKHPKYSYEGEIRNIVTERSDKGCDIVKFKERNGTIIPYIECGIDLDIIKSIMIAPNYDKEYNKYCVHNLVRENGRFGLDIFNSDIPSRY